MNADPDRFALVDRAVEAAGPATNLGSYPTRDGAEARMREQYRTYSFMYLGPLATHELVIIDRHPPMFKRSLWARFGAWRRDRHRRAVWTGKATVEAIERARLREYRADIEDRFTRRRPP